MPASSSSAEAKISRPPLILTLEWRMGVETIVLDPADLEAASPFTVYTTVVWRDTSLPADYVAEVSIERLGDGQYQLALLYREEDQPQPKRDFDLFGTTTLALNTQFDEAKGEAEWVTEPPAPKWDGCVTYKMRRTDAVQDAVFVAVMRRQRRQEAFKRKLIDTYGHCCALSQERCPQALDAAHVLEVQDDGSHDIDNGLLLRTDLHRLWDRGLLHIAADGAVSLDRSLPPESGYRKECEHWRLSPATLANISKKLAQRQALG